MSKTKNNKYQSRSTSMNIHKYLLVFAISLVVFFGMASSSEAACNSGCTTCTPADGNGATIQSCISNAADGAIINVPDGSFSGSFTIDGTKALTIAGAGSDTTKTSGGVSITTGTKMIRVTGFTFSAGQILIWGTGNQWRIDNSKFTGTTGPNIQVDGATYGVIDHNTFSGSKIRSCIWIFQNSWHNGGDGGAASFRTDAPLGTGNAVYVEDNTFTFPQASAGGGAFVDGRSGGRMVVRNNAIINNMWSAHDAEINRERGIRSYEVYNNHFIINSTPNSGGVFQYAMYWRGGTGVIYNNDFKILNCTISNPQANCWSMNGQPMSMYNNRYVTGYTSVGAPWLSVCDSKIKKICIGGAPASCNTDADCTGDAVGPCVNIDGYESGGWPCRDQIGTGKTDPTTGVQASEPLWMWSNKWCYSATSADCTPNINVKTAIMRGQILLNTDYYESASTPKPGYTPYTYPHPLVSGSLVTHTVTPSAGPNGIISPSTPQTVNDGATTQFTITPNTGYSASVGGTCGGSLVGMIYTTNAITADCTVSVTFNSGPPPSTYTLTAAKSGTGSGKVTGTGIDCGSDCTETVSSGASITLTASADSGSIFSGWSGGGCSGTGTCTLTMNSNIQVTASFNQSELPSGTIEAETGTLVSPMQIVSGSQASGGQYIQTTTEYSGTATYSFNINTSGTYKIIARDYASDNGSNSFYVTIDSGSEFVWHLNDTNDPSKFNVWREEEVNQDGAAFAIQLNQGSHTIRFRGREMYAKLDYFRFEQVSDTTPPSAPTGLAVQ